MARVLPDLTGLDKQFDYLVPDELVEQVGPGTRVRVPLAGRRVGGWVVAVGPASDDAPADKLRAIAKVTGHGPSPELLALGGWAAHRWAAGRLRPFLVAASAPRAVPVLPRPSATTTRPGPVDAGAARVMAEGGGVLRRPPSADPVPIVLAAAARGRTLVITPAVDDARRIAARVRRAGLSVAVVPRDWAGAAGGVDVVIGARAAAWAPVPELGAVVVLDEHDEALQEERAPTWHARDVAMERARRAGAPCLLVSPVPSLATLQAAAGALDAPSRNDERAGWPIVEIVDRTQEEPWKRSLVSPALMRHLKDPSRRVVCVLNAPGKARRLACRSCRTLQRCERCQAAVSQTRDGLLRCARCGTERPVVCQACGSSALTVLRPGVSTLRAELEAVAGRTVVEVTAASPARQGGGPPAEIHVGTEAVLHRVASADTVAFLDIDDELLAPRFRADEQALALLARAARLVGPRAGGGRVLVQTRLAHHEVLDAVLHADPGRLTAAALARRAELALPPVNALALVSGPGAHEWVQRLRAGAPDVAVAGPSDGRYLVRAATPEQLADALAGVPRPAARVRVEVDPPRV